jgi:hypothetical protein
MVPRFVRRRPIAGSQHRNQCALHDGLVGGVEARFIAYVGNCCVGEVSANRCQQALYFGGVGFVRL